jgi:hypothetical protein
MHRAAKAPRRCRPVSSTLDRTDTSFRLTAPAKPVMSATKVASTPTKRAPKKTPAADAGKSPAVLIEARIAELQDWRGDLLVRLRDLIRSADSAIVEEWKWNVPVWSCGGIVCTGETYKKAVKLTFPKGASLSDPSNLFNASLDGNTRRAIDFSEGGNIDEKALKALIQAAIALNKGMPSAKRKSAV